MVRAIDLTYLGPLCGHLKWAFQDQTGKLSTKNNNFRHKPARAIHKITALLF